MIRYSRAPGPDGVFIAFVECDCCGNTPERVAYGPSAHRVVRLARQTARELGFRLVRTPDGDRDRCPMHARGAA